MVDTNNKFILRLCTVEYVDDESKGLRIKVRIPPYDSGKDITQLPSQANGNNGIPWCFPILPKMIHVNPKVGELVIVICQQLDSANSQRFFLGPVISQDYMMDCDYDYPDNQYFPKSSARRMFTGSTADKTYIPYPNPDEDGENLGTIPNREDISLRGRGNSDIILSDDEARIRCGFKVSPHGAIKEKLHFNSEDLAYILMRYRKGKDDTGEYNSSINIIGDRINLLSHDSKEYFDMGDRKDLITDKEMEKILEKAHKLPYGDTLVEFLKAFVDIFNRHTHPFPMCPPSLQSTDKDTLSPDWENMLSQSIRIN